MKNLIFSLVASLILIASTNINLSAQSRTPSNQKIEKIRVPGKPANGAANQNKSRNGIKGKTNKTKTSSRMPNGEIGLGGLDIGIGGFAELPNEYSNLEVAPWKSSHITLHTLRAKAYLNQNIFVGTSLAFDFNKYRFVKDISLTPDAANLTITETGENFDKNCLATTMLTVPLTLNYKYHNGSKPAVTVGAGVYGSLLINSKLKQKIDGEKEVIKDNFNLNKTRYGVMARIGYGSLNFYGKYDLSSMFKEAEGPDVQSFSVGISIIPAF